MPPFTYAPFVNPYAGSIGDLLEHRGDAAALTARSIGNAVAAVPQQIQETARAAQQGEAGKLQLDDLQRARKSRLIFEAELRNPSNYNPDGTVDDAKVADRLKKQDVGAWQSWTSIAAANTQNALNLRKTMQDLEVSGLSLEEKRRTLAQAHASAIGKLALTAQDVLTKDPENPQHARDTLLSALAFGASQGWIDPKTAHATAQQFETAAPDAIAGMLGQFITPELRATHEKEAADLAKTTADAAKANAEAENLKRYGTTTAPRANSQESKFLLDGKAVNGDYIPGVNGQPGRYFYNGEDVTARTRPIPAAAAAGDGSSTDVRDAVAGMKAGTLPPQLPGRASKEYIAIMAEAKRQGYDLATAATDWAATQKHIATMNGSQQLRLNQSIGALPEMLDSVDALASKWKAGRFPVLNRATLMAAKGGALGREAATIANQLDAQIADVTADLGNVYMGGNSPTDHALSLAGKSLSGDWSEGVLHDMVALARKNVTIRQNSIRNAGVAGASDTNPYGSQPPQPRATSAPPAEGTEGAVNGVPAVWKTGPQGPGWYAK